MLEEAIRRLIEERITALGRTDLFRAPLVGFSRADDPRYKQLKTFIGDWHQNPTELFPEAVSVVSYFVPFTKEYDVETMYFQLDEAAQEEIAHIFNPFRTEEEEKAYHFDGMALEFVTDWRERLEPWIETDATIRPYTNAPAADDDGGSCGFGTCLPGNIMF